MSSPRLHDNPDMVRLPPSHFLLSFFFLFFFDGDFFLLVRQFASVATSTACVQVRVEKSFRAGFLIAFIRVRLVI
jgi:hypothetical protein